MDNDRIDRSSSRKIALITGASSGLGAEFARQLASGGYDLILTARREERLRQLADSLIAGHSIAVSVVPADLSTPSGMDHVIQVINNSAPLDLLINNAGFGTRGSFAAVDAEKELKMLQVHITAPVLLSRAALPGMISRNRGAVINVSSVAGLLRIRNVLYGSTKAFLIIFSQVLMAELRNTNVRVQALCPGFVYTEFHDTAEYTRYSRTSIPRFLWMKSEEVVSTSIKSLDHRNVICIPGAVYRLVGLLASNSFTSGMITLAAKLVLRKPQK